MRLTGASSFLPVSVRGIAGTATIVSGTWRGESSERSAPAIRARSSSSSSRSSASDDEEDQLAGAALVVLEVHDQAVGDLRQLLDDGVELARAHAHAAAVERRVGAAGDDAAAALGEADPVALAPDARVERRSRRRGSARRPGRSRSATGIDGIGSRDHQLARARRRPRCRRRRRPWRRRPGSGPRSRRRRPAAWKLPETIALQTSVPPLPLMQQDVGAELLVDVVVALGGQRRAGGGERADAREVEVAAELQAGLAAGHEEGRADAHDASAASPRPAATGTPRSGHAGSPSIITIDARSSSAETSAFHIIHAVVVNHSRRSPGLRSQPSPRSLRCSTSMPPWPCTIAFGSPVVPGREQHVERVVEGDRLELERRRARPSSSSQRDGVGELVLAVGHVHDVLERRQAGADRRRPRSRRSTARSR